MSASKSQVRLSDELVPVHKEVSAIYSALHRLLSNTPGSHTASLPSYQGHLNGIENKWKHNGIWGGKLEDNHIPAGQAEMNELYDKCHDIVDRILAKQEAGGQTAGGAGDQAKTRESAAAQQTQEPTATASTGGQPQHTDSGSMDKAKTQMEDFSSDKAGSTDRERNQLTNESAALKQRK